MADMTATLKKFSLPSKWQEPGWRIEQNFSKGVLIGNWSEDRYKVRERERDILN